MSNQGSERACARSKSHLTRRSLLSAAVAAPLAAGEVIMTAVVPPDAELLAAWAAYRQAHRDFDAACAHLPDGGGAADLAPFQRRIDAHQIKLEHLPARSMAGVAVKLRFLFAQQLMTADAHRAAVYGAPLSAELAADMDADDAVMWSLIRDVDHLAASKELSL